MAETDIPETRIETSIETSDRTTRPSAAGIPNVRRFLVGQGISNIGTFFQVVAQSLLVLDLTHSGFALGATMSLQFLPVLVLGPSAGVLIDRIRIPRLLTFTAILAGIEALALGVLTTTGHINLAWILGLSLLLGVAQVGDRAAGQAFLVELVPRDRLASAVAFSSVANSVGRLGGPALAASLYAWHGPAICFYCNAGSYVAVVISLLLLRKRDLLPRTPQPRVPGQLRAGIRYAWGDPTLRRILLSNAIIGAFTFNFAAFYSSLVRLTFHAGAASFGLAESLNAITAVSIGFLLARWLHRPTLRLFALASVLLGLSLIYSAAAPTLTLFLIGMPFFGVVVVGYQTVAQSLLQQHTPNEMQGRIMSLFVLGMIGTTPVGGLLTGWVTDAVSPRASLALGGIAPIGCALWVVWSQRADRSLRTV
ncbi:MAG: putative transporter [Ilumatobacteraceae bacterium]|nr:putative transporter [Ilumatobacteraceae bacterium]